MPFLGGVWSMQNIQRMISELVCRQFFTASVGTMLIDFIKRNNGIKDIEEKDILDIVEKVLGMKFGTGLNLSDEWLPAEHKKKTTKLLAEACMSPGTSANDVSKLFAIYLEICDKNMLRQT